MNTWYLSIRQYIPDSVHASPIRDKSTFYHVALDVAFILASFLITNPVAFSTFYMSTVFNTFDGKTSIQALFVLVYVLAMAAYMVFMYRVYNSRTPVALLIVQPMYVFYILSGITLGLGPLVSVRVSEDRPALFTDAEYDTVRYFYIDNVYSIFQIMSLVFFVTSIIGFWADSTESDDETNIVDKHTHLLETIVLFLFGTVLVWLGVYRRDSAFTYLFSVDLIISGSLLIVAGLFTTRFTTLQITTYNRKWCVFNMVCTLVSGYSVVLVAIDGIDFAIEWFVALVVFMSAMTAMFISYSLQYVVCTTRRVVKHAV